MTESIVSLGKSEEWFWNTELRIVWYLLEKQKELKKIEQKNLAVYIASYVWGKDPDGYDETYERGLIPGVDIPLKDAAIVDCLF